MKSYGLLTVFLVTEAELPSQELAFAEHLVKDKLCYSYGLDGDGRPDLAAGTTGSQSEIHWWRNKVRP